MYVKTKREIIYAYLLWFSSYSSKGNQQTTISGPNSEFTHRGNGVQVRSTRPLWYDPLFVGRADPLKALDRILTLGQSRRVAVLHGPPGIGKTQIAVQFCHTRHTNFSSVFWLNASTKESIGSGFLQAAELIVGHYARLHFTRPPPYARIAEKLGLSGMVDETGRVRSEKTAVEGVKNAVMAWFNLESNTKWLIVYDNYDDPESFMIEEFIPPGSHGKIIVTSRRRGCASIGEGVALNLLDNPDAVDLLLRSCQISEASVSDGKCP